MKIVLVIANLEAGGAERVISELANKWGGDLKNNVNLILLTTGDDFYSISNNVKIHRLGIRTGVSLLNRVLDYVIMIKKINLLIFFIRPDFILSFMNKYNVFVLFSLLFNRTNIFVSERDSPTEKLSLSLSFLRKISYPLAIGVICQTELSKKFIESIPFCNNVISIPNPVRKIKLNENDFDKENIVLNTGRLVPKKGHKDLIKAFANCNHKDWKLIILGEGVLRDELEQLISSLNLENKVELKGQTKNVDYWLNRAKVFAFPSNLEGFPNALAEAMCAGLPCVSYDCPTGPSDLIKDGENGFLVELNNLDLFTEKLNVLMQNENVRLNFSIKSKKVSENLSIEKITNNYLDFCSK